MVELHRGRADGEQQGGVLAAAHADQHQAVLVSAHDPPAPAGMPHKRAPASLPTCAAAQHRQIAV